MNDLDIYYRALLDYRTVTQENRNCVNFRHAISRADADQDQIVITRNICTVDEDWIQAIEEGLVFVEKAIKEERQFIYSEGEVLEIEKVKHFSSESVRHLAKHSNLITREQEGDNIIPDKLYSVERLSDYAVYENRFLYMLLCYLRDFITIRYNKILDLSNKYDGSLQMDKQIDLPKQKMSFSIQMHDERRDDNFLREHNTAQTAIDRIDLILKTVLAFLATPLMEMTGKAPMLQPPITKTNVLKMDNNFKGAVALYDFIIAYDKPGYTVDSHRVELSPFADALSDEMSEAVALVSFLTYSHGLDLRSVLKQEYDAEEARRRDAEIKKAQQQSEALKRRLAANQIDPEEYIASLEKQIKLLEKENRQLEPLRIQLQQLSDANTQLTVHLDAVKLENKSLHAKLDGFEREMQLQLDALKEAHSEQLHQLIVTHEGEIKALEQACQDRIAQLNTQMQELEQQLLQQLQTANEELASIQQKLEKLLHDYDILAEEKLLCLARIKAVRLEHGENINEEDFTEQEKFEQLEKEFETFAKFYRSNWNKTKKKIRQQLLNYKYLKGLNGQ